MVLLCWSLFWSQIKVEGPANLTNSSLVTIFAVLIQSFDDLRAQNSNRLGAANSLFVAAADFVIQHMISTIRDFEEGVEKSDSENEKSENEPEVYLDEEKENFEPEVEKPFMSRRRRNMSDSDLSEGSEEIFFEESEEEEDESVYSQEHESENEEPVRISTQNANNNTNQTIIEVRLSILVFLFEETAVICKIFRYRICNHDSIFLGLT